MQGAHISGFQPVFAFFSSGEIFNALALLMKHRDWKKMQKTLSLYPETGEKNHKRNTDNDTNEKK